MGIWNGKSSKVFKVKYSKNAGKSIKEIYHMDSNSFGQGAFARVYKGYSLQNPKLKVAIKWIYKTYLKPEDLEVIDQEVYVLQALKHPNIVKYYDSIEDEHHLCIITEFWEGLTLNEFIRTYKRLGERRAVKVVHQILKAIQYWHSKNISHRDLKPENIIVDDNNKVKLIDFGLSKLTSQSQLKSILGSPQYMSPEISTGVYTNKIDIWSIGVLLYEMISGEVPYNGRWIKDIKNKIESKDLPFYNKVWTKTSPEWIDLVKSMLIVDPSKRITAKKALKHKWFKKVTYESLEEEPSFNIKNLIELTGTTRDISEVKKLSKKEIEDIVKNHPELNNVKAMCENIDLQNEGTMSIEEIKGVIYKSDLKISDKHISRVINECNQRKDGKINYMEFLAVTVNSRKFEL